MARSEMVPQGGYSGSAERGRGLAIGSSGTFNVFAGVLNAAWEIDLWGRRLQVVQDELARAVAALDGAYRLARLRFVEGLANYFEVLEAQQELFPAELELARVERDRLVAVVQLYRALGGGWTDVPAVPGEIRPVSSEVWPPWP